MFSELKPITRIRRENEFSELDVDISAFTALIGGLHHHGEENL